ncbi:UPF0418 protein C6orf94 [Thecamonas trahens ATCC 50062]|uniref:UPF0418 protein C6orf94 n=1 Tax=Thecamonas trahens ATCC 50062 TaxID=461836 RepID=A0A0L0D5L2_THETB|nr:UPF0418 protein C6orf94 [Thecamonas trahens ATCC 50062]KNC47500.1 UPF0418 protein C6orf94 [Thecamonas trahens ATCC 50062]|eukprot:XP_013759436.1 UPF0418 protein C6orf94 [Thecamonas trahens ATCC 50062]
MEAARAGRMLVVAVVVVAGGAGAGRGGGAQEADWGYGNEYDAGYYDEYATKAVYGHDVPGMSSRQSSRARAERESGGRGGRGGGRRYGESYEAAAYESPAPRRSSQQSSHARQVSARSSPQQNRGMARRRLSHDSTASSVSNVSGVPFPNAAPRVPPIGSQDVIRSVLQLENVMAKEVLVSLLREPCCSSTHTVVARLMESHGYGPKKAKPAARPSRPTRKSEPRRPEWNNDFTEPASTGLIDDSVDVRRRLREQELERAREAQRSRESSRASNDGYGGYDGYDGFSDRQSSAGSSRRRRRRRKKPAAQPAPAPEPEPYADYDGYNDYGGRGDVGYGGGGGDGYDDGYGGGGGGYDDGYGGYNEPAPATKPARRPTHRQSSASERSSGRGGRSFDKQPIGGGHGGGGSFDERPIGGGMPLDEVPIKASGGSGGFDPVAASAPPPGGLVPCSICGRKFAADRVQKHEGACRKLKAGAKKRKTFNVAKQRMDPEMAKAKAAAKRQPVKKAPKKDWRREHEEFVANVRAAREYSAAIKSGADPSSLPPPPSSGPNPDHVQCPQCLRTFAPATAERHIPRCNAKPRAGATRRNPPPRSGGSARRGRGSSRRY